MNVATTTIISVPNHMIPTRVSQFNCLRVCTGPARFFPRVLYVSEFDRPLAQAWQADRTATPGLHPVLPELLSFGNRIFQLHTAMASTEFIALVTGANR